jgi:hypothetical protein
MTMGYPGSSGGMAQARSSAAKAGFARMQAL